MTNTTNILININSHIVYVFLLFFLPFSSVLLSQDVNKIKSEYDNYLRQQQNEDYNENEDSLS